MADLGRSEVSDAMIAAALKAWHDPNRLRTEYVQMRDAIEAALTVGAEPEHTSRGRSAR